MLPSTHHKKPSRNCPKAMQKKCHCLKVPAEEMQFYHCCGYYHFSAECGGRIEDHRKVYDKDRPGKRILFGLTSPG